MSSWRSAPIAIVKELLFKPSTRTESASSLPDLTASCFRVLNQALLKGGLLRGGVSDSVTTSPSSAMNRALAEWLMAPEAPGRANHARGLPMPPQLAPGRRVPRPWAGRVRPTEGHLRRRPGALRRLPGPSGLPRGGAGRQRPYGAVGRNDGHRAAGAAPAGGVVGPRSNPEKKVGPRPTAMAVAASPLPWAIGQSATAGSRYNGGRGRSVARGVAEDRADAQTSAPDG